MVPGDDQRSALLAQMRKGALQYCVLALLRDGERYAPELVEALTAKESLLTTEGTMYPLLSRLRRDGLVETTWQESTSGPPRRYYRLTPEGRKALRQFTHEWQQFARSVDEILEDQQ